MATQSRLKLLTREDQDKLPPFRLTQRDIQIIEAVYTHRALSTDQIQALFFPGNPKQIQEYANKQGEIKQSGIGKLNQCRHRLKLLFHYGYLYREEQPSKFYQDRQPLVYFLDQKGADLLCEHLGIEPGDLDWKPKDNTVSNPFITHLMKTNEVRIATELGAKLHGFTLHQWIDDKTLKSEHAKDYVTIVGPRGGEQTVAIVPDGYFYLQTLEYHFHHFLEVDRGTVVGQYSRWGRRDWARKVQAYDVYYTSGQYQKRYGAKSMRVLTVTTSERRLQNLIQATINAGGKGRFWFTTFDQVIPKTFLTDYIWRKANSDGLHSLTLDNHPKE